MDEKYLQHFVDSIVKYFNLIPNNNITVGAPYLRESDNVENSDVSGLISISGVKSGWVCYSAPKAMIKHFLLSIGEIDTSSINVKDMVGEVANTISGNMRKQFGSNLLISVPKVFDGNDVAGNFVLSSERCYVVPIYWRQYNSSMVVCLY